MRLPSFIRILSLAAALVATADAFLAATAIADVWVPPEPRKFFSSNNRFYIEIIPAKTDVGLFPSGDPQAPKTEPNTPTKKEADLCHGTLYRLGEDGRYGPVWSARLVNAIAPVVALVSDDGAYVVTFDNWARVGHGPDVVVIYDAAGKVIRQFGLEDFLSEEEIAQIPLSAGSRWWGVGHYLDESRGLLMLRVVSEAIEPGMKPKRYGEVKIELKTGRLIRDPQKDE